MEKLSNGTPVTVRFTTQQFAELHALAESEGMEHSEYIRHLVNLDRKAKHAKWALLNQVFAAGAASSTNSLNDNV
jgi:hypothetical protein